jgi:hypothetical protein
MVYAVQRFARSQCCALADSAPLTVQSVFGGARPIHFRQLHCIGLELLRPAANPGAGSRTNGAERRPGVTMPSRIRPLGGRVAHNLPLLLALLAGPAATLVCAPLSMELEVPDGVVADDAPMAAMAAAQMEPAGRSLGGRLRSMAEDFIPTAIIDKVAEARKPQDTDGSQTTVPDDGEGCTDQIGKADVDGMNPLYRCAFDRKKCYEYAPDEVEGETGPYCEGNVRAHPTLAQCPTATVSLSMADRELPLRAGCSLPVPAARLADLLQHG